MFLLESPWPILFVGIVAEAILATALVQTRRGCLLWYMIGVAILAGAGLGVERYVVTDREAVENTLDAAANAILADNLDRLIDCISPSAENVRADAKWVFGRVQVDSLYIRGLEITVDARGGHKTARARFRAIGQGRDQRGEFPYQAYNRTVEVDFRLEGDRWRIVEYSVEGLNVPRFSR